MISVNLLPPEIQNEIAASKKNRVALHSLYKMIGLLILSVLIFIGLLGYLLLDLRSKKETYESKTKVVEKYGALEENARKIADRINTIKKINAEGSSWTGVIEEINTIVPTGISLNSIKMDSNPKTRGQITGYATSKNNVAAFREALENSKKIQYVDIENSTTQEDPITKREVESFTITFSLDKEALK